MISVKICGITRLEDATAAVALGATAIGLVFAKSPRSVSVEKARILVNELPTAIERVGVFVDADQKELLETADRVGLTILQLHGEETPQLVDALVRAGKRVVKAVRLQAAQDLEIFSRYGKVEAFLVDTWHPELAGGTGRTADWKLAKQAALSHPVWLAGGLTALNVNEAIGEVDPIGVDLSSGLESSPGIKDREKLVALFRALGRESA